VAQVVEHLIRKCRALSSTLYHHLKKKECHAVCWYMPLIPALRRLRQEGHKFETSLDYILRPCLKTNKCLDSSWALIFHIHFKNQLVSFKINKVLV
jgi:hypothetical protein